ncbi:unannotated protein [freshwater metagenome]|uniref:Cell shape-determining protein MreC n=1 Tax=freshwater metagenome TaxID=449393 RepID=A0A6J7IM70_9ZZZZ|nr:hypothetical protein [Actinomycetota bacterium]
MASALVLLTVYFGESSSGGLHGVQRGVMTVLSPIQEGASRALKPVRDLAGWVGDTFRAKGDVQDLRRENAALRRQAISGTDAVRQNQELRKLLALDQAVGLAAAAPVAARVIGQSPTVWYSRIFIDKGTGAGIRVGQPVVTGDGLIGQVTTAAANSAVVTLVTDPEIAVPARTSTTGVPGVIQVAAAGSDDLLLDYTTRRDRLERGMNIVTAGTMSTSDRLLSAYPPGIPIGRVTRVEDPGTDSQKVHVRPFADLRRLEIVQVLTQRVNGNRP